MDEIFFDQRKAWILRVIPETEVSVTGGTNTVQAWEMIEAGRYMPRRTRGSFPGRELG